jgi:hypothetical protein
MGTFSALTIIAGILSIFGSFLSLGLTFLETVKGEAWAPTRTGQFIAHYVGVDLGLGRFFDSIGIGTVVDALMFEPLYKTLFALGLILIFVSLTARGMNKRA